MSSVRASASSPVDDQAARDLLMHPPPTLAADEAAALAATHFGRTGVATPLDSERDQNFLVTAPDGRRAVLKIANSAQLPEVADFQLRALLHLAEHCAEFPAPRVVPTGSGQPAVVVPTRLGSLSLSCLEWIEGRMLRGIALDADGRAELGRTLAALNIGLRGYFHAHARYPLLWDVCQASRVRPLANAIHDSADRQRVTAALAAFEHEALPRARRLRSQVIFNDLNPSNVLVHRTGPRVVGVIDFGDIVHGPLVQDVAVAMSYMVRADGDALRPAEDLLRGYHAKLPLTGDELELILPILRARLATTLAITAWRAELHPTNAAYILRNASQARDALAAVDECEPQAVRDRWLHACELAPPRAAALPFTASDPSAADEIPTQASAVALQARRRQVLGPGYRLFYDEPLHLVRGAGVWLWDAAGKTYLDAYNNVAVVGHCHPRVVAALARQAALLNTHTRYLHELVLEYAERLSSLLPAPLRACMFTCSGSEANELALRIARAVTGKRGLITTAHAYHGNTTVLAALSAHYYASAESPGPEVRFVEAPIGRHVAAFSREVRHAAASLADAGYDVAALIIDPLFVSDGIATANEATALAVREASQCIHDAGGLVIADEVQSGLGRCGEALWGFHLHGLRPDLVTLGKPLGNGHPIGAVVTSKAVAEEFARSTRYFNTFGGNPVSAAAGLAVLAVLANEALPQRAARVGVYMRERLSGLRMRRAVITDVRGAGLFFGVELDPSHQRAADLTHFVVNTMKSRGVLIQSIGRGENVLKIRPPLPFGAEHVDRLIAALEDALDEAARGSFLRERVR